MEEGENYKFFVTWTRMEVDGLLSTSMESLIPRISGRADKLLLLEQDIYFNECKNKAHIKDATTIQSSKDDDVEMQL